eukprot:CAMPEP_0198207456 /NCGR_PEP_ID=MMETSP1445-20131203/10902_1 /TAXON_ID=36898 /ORGANISM="Pyramimonas sp., Strain CCMP2087" /LENGTH=320 /DNA_ID=CAMNT_0043880491 /DNA_START=61 /DNA_END=1020 /DNA_ORIENTATION=-
MYTACSNGVVAFARVSKCTPAAAVGHSPHVLRHRSRGFASLQSRVSRHIAIVTSGRYKSQLIVHAEASVDLVDVEPNSVAVKDVQPPKKKGKTVVITGGSQGVGKQTALLFAKKGYNVVVAAREPTRLQEVAQLVRGIAGSGKSGEREQSGMAVVTDITNPESVEELASAVAAQYESVDVLVNNAGVCCTGSFAETTLDDWNSQMQVNCLGAVAVTKAFLPLIEASRGAIVNVNSFAGVMPLRNMTAYTASKYALAGFTDALRYEVAPKGVHVAQVHPGVIKSDFMERAQFRGEGAAAARENMTKMLEVRRVFRAHSGNI